MAWYTLDNKGTKMPKSGKQQQKGKGKIYALPSAQFKKDFGIPKIQTSKLIGRQAMPYGKSKPAQSVPVPPTSIDRLSLAADVTSFDQLAEQQESIVELIDTGLMRDSSSKAFLRELRKVIERSDVIIQVLDARDPEGTRSRWVEDEVRKSEGQGKKLLAVVNKIDLVPRANLEAWLKYLRHSFPCMPFKSSTQNQRQHLSQNNVPLSQPSVAPGQTATLPPIPTTSSSLGAPALLHLLKQYALSRPHTSLTVGVVGYPNVGKSSLINSIKRSRACAVAAMPGKTRVVQEVAIDKGVKLLDCPGVVIADLGLTEDGPEARRKQAELMLRNCVKAELVEDPVAPVEVILTKIDPAVMRKLYSIPPYDDVREFLIRIALVRGRLGKGGIPDLHGAAVSVLRDWNAGKISYYTHPPTAHPSAVSAPTADTALSGDVAMDEKVTGGDQILNTLSEAFTIDGLFDHAGDEAAFDGEDAAGDENAADAEDVAEVASIIPTQPTSNFPAIAPDSPESDNMSLRSLTPPLSPFHTEPALASSSGAFVAPRLPAQDDAKLFTSEELSVLPSSVLSRQKLKQQAKRDKKRRSAAERTEGELMLDFMDMGVSAEQRALNEARAQEEAETRTVGTKRMKREKKREKERQRKMQVKAMVGAGEDRDVAPMDEEMGGEEQKEAEFASFLKSMGADDDDDL